MRLVTLTCALLLLSPFCGSAQAPSFEDLELRVRERLRSYDGMEFTITSSFYQEDLNEDVKIRDETILLNNIRETVRLHFPEKGPPWKYWGQEIQDRFDEQWIVNLFKVTNVVETRNFFHKPEIKGQWNEASIIPWHEWYERDGRSFFTVLGFSIIGLSLFDADNMSVEFVSNEMSGGLMQFVREYTFEGHKAFVFAGGNAAASAEFHIVYPQGIVVHYEVNWLEVGRKRVVHVDKIAVSGGVWYPQKGSFYQDAHTFSEYKCDYKFEVTGVRRFEPELLQNWFPEWPSGTSIRDRATDKSTRIPPSERQLKKAAEMLPSYEITPRSTAWLAFRITLVVVGLAMILYALYRMREKNKNDSA